MVLPDTKPRCSVGTTGYSQCLRWTRLPNHPSPVATQRRPTTTRPLTTDTVFTLLHSFHSSLFNLLDSLLFSLFHSSFTLIYTHLHSHSSTLHLYTQHPILNTQYSTLNTQHSTLPSKPSTIHSHSLLSYLFAPFFTRSLPVPSPTFARFYFTPCSPLSLVYVAISGGFFHWSHTSAQTKNSSLVASRVPIGAGYLA